MQPVRSPASTPNGQMFYTLYEVRCPGTRLVGGTEAPCGALWDRREVIPDRAVHQVSCKNCSSLILYYLTEEVVEDRAVVVVLSIQRSREKPR